MCPACCPSLQCALETLITLPMVHSHVEQAACQGLHATAPAQMGTQAHFQLPVVLTAPGVQSQGLAHRLVSYMHARLHQHGRRIC